MTYHINPECEKALIKLDDELCKFERICGRGYTLILIPETPDEKIHISVSGKPPPQDADVKQMFELAMQAREV